MTLCWLVIFALHAQAQSTEINRALKVRQDCEMHSSRGDVALRNNQLDAAKQSFEQGLKSWPQCYFAFEGLASLEERKGDVRQAIEYLLLAKHHSPDERWPHLNFHVGRLYIEMRYDDRAEVYLKVAASQGAFPVQVNYLLGYMAYKNARYFEAESYFHSALVAAEDNDARKVDRSYLQVIHFYLAEIYTRLGFTREAIVSLWRSEEGESAEVRRSAWRLHSIHNRIKPTFGFGLFHRYDSNVALFSQGQSTVPELSGSDGHAVEVIWQGAVQTSPARRFSVGAQGVASLNYHLSSDLGRFDEMRIAPTFWGRYWDLKDLRATARYEVSRVGYGRTTYNSYEWVHGPGLTGEYFIFNRSTLSVSYDLQTKSYGQEAVTAVDSRGGVAHVAALRLGMDGPNPWWRPAGTYRFTMNQADGSDFKYVGHSLELMNSIRLFNRTEGTVGAAYEKRKFSVTGGGTGRQDGVMRLRLGARTKLLGPFIASIDAAYTRALSTVSVFSYDRLEVMTGMIFHFD